MVWETGEPGENLLTFDGQPLPCHMLTPGFDPWSQRWQSSALTTALSRPVYCVCEARNESIFIVMKYAPHLFIWVAEGDFSYIKALFWGLIFKSGSLFI